MNIIEVKKLGKIYNQFSANQKIAIEDLDLTIKKKEFISIMGPSGSGKTTLINVLSTIDNCTSGKILIDGSDITTMNEIEKANMRKNKIGFIFQDYNLINSLTVKDNILFSLRLIKVHEDIQNDRFYKIIKSLNIEDIINKYPNECSGGQQQRVAIARALIAEPQIVFADEPTGNLDSLSSKELMELFVNINIQNETTLIVVTHDNLVASYSNKMFYMKDGKLDTCIQREGKSQEDYYKEIMFITAQMNLRKV